MEDQDPITILDTSLSQTYRQISLAGTITRCIFTNCTGFPHWRDMRTIHVSSNASLFDGPPTQEERQQSIIEKEFCMIESHWTLGTYCFRCCPTKVLISNHNSNYSPGFNELILSLHTNPQLWTFKRISPAWEHSRRKSFCARQSRKMRSTEFG